MNSSQLFIPTKINVGFQSRSDTYTGSLAYIIYWDKSGKLRKETSWQNWRDKKIEPKVFENEPTEGFVLNKNVGGYKSDWNFRQSAIRVYDPRGFEFEISLENLLFILNECSAIKGKGLDGQFVYAWAGTDLVLLPTSCDDYKKCTDFTELQGKKFSKKDLVIGNVYRDKNQVELLYLGRMDKWLAQPKYKIITKMSKDHVFTPLKNGLYNKKDGHFGNFTFNNNVSEPLSEKHPQTAEAIQDYWESLCGSEIVEVAEKPIKPKFTKNYNRDEIYRTHWVKTPDGYNNLYYWSYNLWHGDKNNKTHTYSFGDEAFKITPPEVEVAKRLKSEFDKQNTKSLGYSNYSWSREDYLVVSDNHFEHYQPISVTLTLKSGTKVSLEKYLNIYRFKNE